MGLRYVAVVAFLAPWCFSIFSSVFLRSLGPAPSLATYLYDSRRCCCVEMLCPRGPPGALPARNLLKKRPRPEILKKIAPGQKSLDSFEHSPPCAPGQKSSKNRPRPEIFRNLEKIAPGQKSLNNRPRPEILEKSPPARNLQKIAPGQKA